MDIDSMNYEHTQTSPLGWILLVIGVAVLVIARLVSNQTGALLASSIVAIALIFTSLCFKNLTVRDENDFLSIRFGPLPLFRTRIAYSEITEVEPCRSNIIDGWGIHYIPGRGAIYNIWGFDCVRIKLRKRIIRIGTDDKEALVSFLKTRIQSP